MDYSFIMAIVALLISLFAVFRVYTFYNILVARIERLKDKNSMLEHKLTEYKSTVNRNNPKRDGRTSAVNEPVAQVREPAPTRQQPKQERQPKEQRPQPNQQQPKEQRQQPNQNQPQQPRQQGQQPNQNQPQQPRQQGQQPNQQQPQNQKKKENRRRNEAMERQENEQRPPRPKEQLNQNEESLEMLLEKDRMINFGIENQVQLPEEQVQHPDNYTERKYAIIPEDGIIRQHQLQVQPDSDSYIEIDMPAYDKSNMTRYRFNMSGNHAFVIAQGIDRLENAFSFVKPSNRKVSQVVLLEDGVLEKVDSGWKIYEKARIDFR